MKWFHKWMHQMQHWKMKHTSLSDTVSIGLCFNINVIFSSVILENKL